MNTQTNNERADEIERNQHSNATAGHTPGEWRIACGHPDDGFAICGNYCPSTNRLLPDGSEVCEHVALVKHEQDARLIAAAPDMLEACDFAERELRARFATPDTEQGRRAMVIMNQLRAAIARATTGNPQPALP